MNLGSLKPSGACQLSTRISVQKHLHEINSIGLTHYEHTAMNTHTPPFSCPWLKVELKCETD